MMIELIQIKKGLCDELCNVNADWILNQSEHPEYLSYLTFENKLLF